MLTNDIAALKAGDGCYAAYLTPQGRMISDMRVIALADRIHLETPPQTTQIVLQKLDQFIFTEDVKLADVTDATVTCSLHGPASASIAGDSLAIPVATLQSLPEHHVVGAVFEGGQALAVARGDSADRAFDLVVDRAVADRLRERIVAAGAEEMTPNLVTVLRVEAGIPSFPEDMDGDTIPLEAGIEARAISQTKGCYPGQEIITRVLHRGGGRLSRLLVGIVIDSQTVPDSGDIVNGDDGKEAGRITSAVFSPLIAAPLALGYVRWELKGAGARVRVQHGTAELPAVVTSFPIAPHGQDR